MKYKSNFLMNIIICAVILIVVSMVGDRFVETQREKYYNTQREIQEKLSKSNNYKRLRRGAINEVY